MASVSESRSLSDCAALEYILIGDLRDLLEEPLNEVNCKWLSAVLDTLLVTMPRRMDLQRQGGYLSDILEENPGWYSQVERLDREQSRLYEKLCDLRSLVTDDANEDDARRLQSMLRHDLREWMNSLVAHYRHERRLIQTAYTVDVGGSE